MSLRFSRRMALFGAAAATLAFSTTADAQSGRGPRFGALLGASITKINDLDPTGDNTIGDAIESKSKAGFQVGAYLQLPLAGALSLQPELHYIQKGAKFEGEDVEFGDAEVSLKLAYVEVPVLLRMDLGSSGLRPFIVAGPSFALRTSCKFSFAFEGNSLNADCDEGELDEGGEAEDPIKKTDIGGIVGAGLAGNLGGRTLSAQLRYSRGFTSIANTSADVSPKNSGFSVVFGIGF